MGRCQPTIRNLRELLTVSWYQNLGKEGLTYSPHKRWKLFVCCRQESGFELRKKKSANFAPWCGVDWQRWLPTRIEGEEGTTDEKMRLSLKKVDLKQKPAGARKRAADWSNSRALVANKDYEPKHRLMKDLMSPSILDLSDGDPQLL